MRVCCYWYLREGEKGEEGGRVDSILRRQGGGALYMRTYHTRRENGDESTRVKVGVWR